MKMTKEEKRREGEKNLIVFVCKNLNKSTKF